MTVETYLLFVAPIMILGFGAAMYAVIDAADRRQTRLVPVRARKRDVRR